MKRTKPPPVPDDARVASADQSIQTLAGDVAGDDETRSGPMNMQTVINPSDRLPAGRLKPARKAPARGTHDLIDDDRFLRNLPDLRSGRTIDDALFHLDDIARRDPQAYASEWLAEMRDIGCDATVDIPPRGKSGLYFQCPCDPQTDERQSRIGELSSHMHMTRGARGRVIAQLILAGHYSDNRAAEPRETTRALRAFLDAGFRVMINLEGELEASGGMPVEYMQAGDDRRAEIKRAAQEFDWVWRRWKNRRQLARAVRMLGKVHQGSGWTVLERRTALKRLS